MSLANIQTLWADAHALALAHPTRVAVPALNGRSVDVFCHRALTDFAHYAKLAMAIPSNAPRNAGCVHLLDDASYLFCVMAINKANVGP